jgi:diguanylate cyclase (GGDEF)-like protein/PAS domain S-box-containing protein
MSEPSYQDLQKLFELSVDAMCVASADGVLLSVNPALALGLGYSEQELVGSDMFMLVHPDDRDRTLTALQGNGRGESTILFEVRSLTAGGETRWFQWSARADLSSGRVYASGRDVTSVHIDHERLKRYADLLERTQTELKEALGELTRVANTDPLTGLLNRRAFETRSKDMLANSQLADLAFAIFDIDNFKAINDAHGHPTGDVVLREVARRIQSAARRNDVVARWGGEEFVALLPESTLGEARIAAERIAQSVSARPVVVGSLSLQMRLSGGVTVRDGSEIVDLLGLVKAADHALLQAKRNGRDRIEVAQQTDRRLAA